MDGESWKLKKRCSTEKCEAVQESLCRKSLSYEKYKGGHRSTFTVKETKALPCVRRNNMVEGMVVGMCEGRKQSSFISPILTWFACELHGVWPLLEKMLNEMDL